jgi:hypothetical protein
MKISTDDVKELAQQIYFDYKITNKSIDVLKEYLMPIAEKLKADTSNTLEDLNKKIEILLPEELAMHAINEGKKGWRGRKSIFKGLDFSGSMQVVLYKQQVIEYLAAEIIELAGNLTAGKKTITPKLVEKAINDDRELAVLKSSEKVSRKGSRRVSKKASRKGSRRVSKKASRKGSRRVSKKATRKGSRRVSKKASRKGSRRVSKKASRKGSRRVSKKASRKGSRRVSKKASRKVSRKGSRQRSNKPKSMTVVELRKLCKQKGISGYSGKKKAELLKMCK